MARIFRSIFCVSLMVTALYWIIGTPQVALSQNLNYLHTDGNLILDGSNNPVIITGLSWFGLETENYAPHGLWARSMESLLDQIVQLGFNTIRLPYSNQLFDPASTPNGINYDLNPGLEGLNGLEIMDKVIAGARERGLKVILDRHRPDSHSQSELWYPSQYSEERWIDDWVMLVKRYSEDGTVIGVDLHNEPHGQATWGSGDPATDWQLAAERAGNAVLKANPNLLIIVQGVEQYQGDPYWWGGNLIGAREFPVQLDVPNRLVYSPHTYGPGVYPQPWFSDPSFPENMPEIWDRHWGYLNNEGISPVIVGEFGGRSVKNDKEGVWQRALVAYLQEHQISYLYWTLNPNSGDTGGILLDDWQTVDPEKEKLLSSYQAPLIGTSQGKPAAGETTLVPSGTSTQIAPSATIPTQMSTASSTPSAVMPTSEVAGQINPGIEGVRVRYRTSDIADPTTDAKPELIIANDGQTPIHLEELKLVYWFKDDPGQTYAFNCDWAQIGCENILGTFKAYDAGLYALQIQFRPGLEQLLPGHDTGEIKLRFNRADWSQFSQSDDFSFSNSPDYIDWEKVSLYLNGRLAWGQEPGSVQTSPIPETATEPPVTQSPTQPAPTTSIPPEHSSAIPFWAILAATALAAFAAGAAIAAIWFFRSRR